MKQESTADEEEDGNDFIPGSSNKKQESTADDEEYGNDFVPGSYKKTSVEDVEHPNAIYVDNLNDYKELYDLVDHLELDRKASPKTAKRLLKECMFAGQSTGLHTNKIQEMVSTTMKKYAIVKQKLTKSYEEFTDVSRKALFQEILYPFVKKIYPDYVQQLQDGHEKVKMDKTELEIFVLGETSAGKSTFLNVLMGECILPLHALHTTSCLCRLHNSETRLVTYQDESGKEMKILLSKDPDEVRQKLKSIVAKDDESDNKPLKVVDIYWPIPVLHDNVVLVDTPGIGERENLTEKVMQQLPHAAGYIFIVDSSHAGGVQKGGVIKLLKQIKSDADRKKDEFKDFSNVIFICNKWDKVDGPMKEGVWKDTIDKFKDLCGKLEVCQVLKFNAQLELKLLKLRANPTAAFQTLLENLESLLKSVIDKRIGDSYRNLQLYTTEAEYDIRIFEDDSTGTHWIYTFMTELDNSLGARIKAVSPSTRRSHERMEEAKGILERAAKKLERDFDELEQLVETTKKELINDLQNYLAQRAVKESACDSVDIDLSLRMWRTIDFKRFKNIGPKLVCDRLEKVISKWLKNGTLKCASSSIDQRLLKMELELGEVLAVILKLDIGVNHVSNAFICFCSGTGFVSEMAMLLVVKRMAPSLVLLAVALTSLVICLITLPTSFCSHASFKQETWREICNKAIQQSTSKLMAHFASGKTIDQLLHSVFEQPYKRAITKFREDSLRKIQSKLSLLHDMTSDFRNGGHTLSILLRLRSQLFLPSQYLRKANTEYCSQDGVPCDTLLVNEGNFGKTEISHLHHVSRPHHGKKLTLRVIQPGFIMFHLQELLHLRTLKHRNFASFEGIVFCTSLVENEDRCGCSDTSLKLLFEHTVGDLETYAFNKPEVQGCIEGSSAESFYLAMAGGIINGLTYVHGKGFVHGHLELSAVLLSGDLTPKLCDISILPDIKDRNYAKCIFHVAPEVIKGHENGPDADLYSYGILMWELWYVRHTRPTRPHEEFTICDGERPDFKDKLPNDLMIELIKSCWAADPKQRPQARNVAHLLDK